MRSTANLSNLMDKVDQSFARRQFEHPQAATHGCLSFLRSAIFLIENKLGTGMP